MIDLPSLPDGSFKKILEYYKDHWKDNGVYVADKYLRSFINSQHQHKYDFGWDIRLHLGIDGRPGDGKSETQESMARILGIALGENEQGYPKMKPVGTFTSAALHGSTEQRRMPKPKLDEKGDFVKDKEGNPVFEGEEIVDVLVPGIMLYADIGYTDELNTCIRGDDSIATFAEIMTGLQRGRISCDRIKLAKIPDWMMKIVRLQYEWNDLRIYPGGMDYCSYTTLWFLTNEKDKVFEKLGPIQIPLKQRFWLHTLPALSWEDAEYISKHPPAKDDEKKLGENLKQEMMNRPTMNKSELLARLYSVRDRIATHTQGKLAKGVDKDAVGNVRFFKSLDNYILSYILWFPKFDEKELFDMCKDEALGYLKGLLDIEEEMRRILYERPYRANELQRELGRPKGTMYDHLKKMQDRKEVGTLGVSGIPYYYLTGRGVPSIDPKDLQRPPCYDDQRSEVSRTSDQS